MLRALGKAEDTSIAYGEFRRFAILMPRDKLVNDKELNLKWFESATCVPIGGAPLQRHRKRLHICMSFQECLTCIEW